MNYKAALNVRIRDVGGSAVWGLEGAIETMTVFVWVPWGLSSSRLPPQIVIHTGAQGEGWGWQQRAESRAV